LEQVALKASDDSGARSKTAQRQEDLEREPTSEDNSWRNAQRERRLKITQLETRLALDRDKLDRTSRVVSPAAGVVDQFLVAMHEQVHDGAPVVLLHAVRAKQGTENSETPYDAIVFVPADSGAMVHIGDFVQVVPATMRPELHGYIRARIVSVGELPATKLTVEEALGHPDIADALLRRFAGKGLLRVKVKLIEANTRMDPNGIPRLNRFEWSSSSGARQNLKTGTMCQAEIVIERKPLIHLIIPWSTRISKRRGM
jgi:HlyD family secretion protein